MCGIAGIVSSVPLSNVELNSMVTSLIHRGPDANGTYLDETKRFALGHTRLSIIDLSEAANQPFVSSNGRFVIVFNGEVYNFPALRKELEMKKIQFKTNSDTEVIVEAFSTWGEQMVGKLEGMFAIAIFDKELNHLSLFRDRFGKKPLYYFQSNGLFAFASEIKSLLSYPQISAKKKVNKNAITAFLHLGYVPEPETIFENIFKFPAGYSSVIGKDVRQKLNPYWKLQEVPVSPVIKNPVDAKNEFTGLISAAVKKRLISDVPLGVFLSGGVDSSLITAVAAKQKGGTLKTFSIGFHESRFDESNFAKEVARHLKTDHTKFILPEKEAANILEKYLRHFDEPFADTSSIPTMLVSELARKQVKVALTGDGGDELFLGYGAYTWANRLQNSFWKVGNEVLPQILRMTGKSRWERVAHLLDTKGVTNIRSHIFSQEQYFFSQREIEEELLQDKSLFKPFQYDESFLRDRNLKESEKQAFFDLQFYLKDDLLVKVDRSSMYYGLECRCPLLDDGIVNFALRLHHSLKMRGGERKWLLKQVLSEYLPTSLVNRPKWGFSIPLSKWLKGDLNFLLEEYLNEELVNKIGLFDKRYVSKLKNDFLSGKDYLYNRVWVIIVLQKWWKENLI